MNRYLTGFACIAALDAVGQTTAFMTTGFATGSIAISMAEP